jgi:hypothetical protein
MAVEIVSADVLCSDARPSPPRAAGSLIIRCVGTQQRDRPAHQRHLQHVPHTSGPSCARRRQSQLAFTPGLGDVAVVASHALRRRRVAHDRILQAIHGSFGGPNVEKSQVVDQIEANRLAKCTAATPGRGSTCGPGWRCGDGVAIPGWTPFRPPPFRLDFSGTCALRPKCRKIQCLVAAR